MCHHSGQDESDSGSFRPRILGTIPYGLGVTLDNEWHDKTLLVCQRQCSPDNDPLERLARPSLEQPHLITVLCRPRPLNGLANGSAGAPFLSEPPTTQSPAGASHCDSPLAPKRDLMHATAALLWNMCEKRVCLQQASHGGRVQSRPALAGPESSGRGTTRGRPLRSYCRWISTALQAL